MKAIHAALFASMVLAAWSAASLRAQTPAGSASRQSFEVASVKPNKSGAGPPGFVPRVDRFTRTNVTLGQLIQSAYPRRAFETVQIVGGPDWINSDRFDIVAKIEDGAGTLLSLYTGDGKSSPSVYLMLRTLLEERFKLAVHYETREMPIYALVLARTDRQLGPKLVRSDVDCDKVLADTAAEMTKTGRPPPLPPGQGPPCSIGGPPGRFSGNDITMQWFAGALTASVNRLTPTSPSVNRVVVDRTGLGGNFDLTLEWALDELSPDVQGGSIFTALQEQLGLKLESTRGPVDVLVIDRAEQPTPD